MRGGGEEEEKEAAAMAKMVCVRKVRMICSKNPI